jgi:hypothetical protein
MIKSILVNDSKLVGRKVFGQWGAAGFNYGVIIGETIYNEVVIKWEDWEAEGDGIRYTEIKNLINEEEVANFDSIGVYLFTLETTEEVTETTEQIEKSMMEIEIKNGSYLVDLQTGEVYNKFNGTKLDEQERIDHIINVAKRIQKIRNIYKSKLKGGNKVKYTNNQFEIIEKMVSEFSKVHNNETRKSLIDWYSFASGIKNEKTVRQIMTELKAI